MQKVIQYKFWEKLSQNGKLRATKFSFKKSCGNAGAAGRRPQPFAV
jgi:hypothetical protein